MGPAALEVDFDGHRLAYRVSGQGPALVVLYLYRRRADLIQASVLGATWQVFQVFPLGYGYSERVPGYAGQALADQVMAVLDRHCVDRFVVWAYSAGAAMAACIARETRRAVGLVMGGCAPDFLTPGIMRQMDRRLGADHPSRSLWWYFNRFDWIEELSAMSCARLLYWGSEDRQMATRLQRMRDELSLPPGDVDFAEFEGLDHAACNTEDALRRSVILVVVDWSQDRLGQSW